MIVSGSNGNFNIELSYAGSNPMVPLSPDIMSIQAFSIIEDKTGGMLTITGMLTGDNFPQLKHLL